MLVDVVQIIKGVFVGVFTVSFQILDGFDLFKVEISLVAAKGR